MALWWREASFASRCCSHRPSCGWKTPDGWKFIQMHENRWGRLLPQETGIPHYLRLRSGPGPPIATMGGPGGPPGGPRYRRGCGTKPAGTSLRSIWSSSRSSPSICPIIWCISCSFFRPFIISGDPSIPSSTSPFGSNCRFASDPKERDLCSFFME